MKAAELIVKTLKNEDVEYIFGALHDEVLGLHVPGPTRWAVAASTVTCSGTPQIGQRSSSRGTAR